MTRAKIRQAEAIVAIMVERILKLDTKSRKDFESTIGELCARMDVKTIMDLETNLCELLWPEVMGGLIETYTHLTDDEIRQRNLTQFLCRNCNFVCDASWLVNHDHLCMICFSDNQRRRRSLREKE